MDPPLEGRRAALGHPTTQEIAPEERHAIPAGTTPRPACAIVMILVRGRCIGR